MINFVQFVISKFTNVVQYMQYLIQLNLFILYIRESCIHGKILEYFQFEKMAQECISEVCCMYNICRARVAS